MPVGAKKGDVRNPNGRPKGTPNKTTLVFKEALNNLLELAAPQMVEWLERVAKDDPAKALDQIGKLAEYVHPKLGRTEVQPLDRNGNPADQQPINVFINGVAANVKDQD